MKRVCCSVSLQTNRGSVKEGVRVSLHTTGVQSYMPIFTFLTVNIGIYAMHALSLNKTEYFPFYNWFDIEGKFPSSI